ncbi:MAG: uberolysin/carnocyclin family circular bacteriocin, partial [Rubrobacteraceae bacterium]|nr:uberolysin/carnocyclin family circular bacteriocin [Rubrobacteraceae bacterium]
MHPEQGRAGKLLINACMTDLATNLGISYYAAKKAIDIIVTFSNIALILSL